MSKTLEKREHKIQVICDELKENTLAPAKKEAEQMIIEAERYVEKIIAEAHEKAEELIRSAHQKMEQERNIFHSALEQAAKQALETLRQSVQNNLFNPELMETVQNATHDEKWIARLLEALVSAIEEKGIEADLEAVVSKNVNSLEVNALLSHRILKKLKKETVQLGEFSGGAMVRAEKKQMILMLTDEIIQKLLTDYLRKDFRKLFFGNL